jgi:NADPH:quinone reductase-like Zn-dependent oxidoreductase
MRLASGLRRPKESALGVDLAGVVESVGANVTQLRPGDEVYGQQTGAFAEYVRVDEDHVAPKPVNLTFEEAAAVPVAATTALQGLRDKGRLRSGQRLLIVGASGGVGTFAVQIAKSLGAHVTGVCSTGNVELVRSLGADEVVDYTLSDFTTSGQRYDVVLDNAGSRPLSDLRRVMSPGARLVIVGAGPGRWIGPVLRPLEGLVVSPFVSQKLVPFLASQNREDLLRLTELIEAGAVTPVIDRRYPLGEVADAVRYVEAGHARAKVVITV